MAPPWLAYFSCRARDQQTASKHTPEPPTSGCLHPVSFIFNFFFIFPSLSLPQFENKVFHPIKLVLFCFFGCPFTYDENNFSCTFLLSTRIALSKCIASGLKKRLSCQMNSKCWKLLKFPQAITTVELSAVYVRASLGVQTSAVL